jgi:hypothetical protein
LAEGRKKARKERRKIGSTEGRKGTTGRTKDERKEDRIIRDSRKE